MAIASVARKATIRKDDTLFKANQLVQQQKAVAKKLQTQQDRLNKESQDKVEEGNAKLMLEGMKIGAGTVPQWELLAKGDMDAWSANVYDPSISNAQSYKDLAGLTSNAKVVSAATTDMDKLVTEMTSTDALKGETNLAGLSVATNQYINEYAPNATKYDGVTYREQVLKNPDIYNIGSIIGNWGEGLTEQVASSISTKNLAGGNITQISEHRTAGNFLVIGKDGKVAVDNDGKNTVMLTGESLQSFEKYSKGATAHIDKYIKENTKDGGSRFTPALGTVQFDDIVPTRLDAMEALLREQGAFNTQTTVDNTFRVNPKDKADTPDKKAIARQQALGVRVDFITGKGDNLVGSLKGQKGVVASGQRTDEKGNKIGGVEKTSHGRVYKKDGRKGTGYTIVTDLRKLQETSPEDIMADINGDGKMVAISTITGSAPIIEVRNIFVDDADKESGYIELNDYFNRSVPAAQRIGGDTFINALRAKDKDLIDLTSDGLIDLEGL